MGLKLGDSKSNKIQEITNRQPSKGAAGDGDGEDEVEKPTLPVPPYSIVSKETPNKNTKNSSTHNQRLTEIPKQRCATLAKCAAHPMFWIFPEFSSNTTLYSMILVNKTNTCTKHIEGATSERPQPRRDSPKGSELKERQGTPIYIKK